MSISFSDVTILRQEHHILGKLVGCLPRLPRQNVQLGRPLQLLQEEATLLVEKGRLVLLPASQCVLVTVCVCVCVGVCVCVCVCVWVCGWVGGWVCCNVNDKVVRGIRVILVCTHWCLFC